MPLNLNNPEELTLNGVRALIAEKDDSQDRQLRVETDGTAFLSDDVGAEHLDGILFRFETWDAGNGYVGAKAAKDDAWITRVYEALKKNWPNPTARVLDNF